MIKALEFFGAPIAAHGIRQEDFEVEDTVYQIGLPPRRIDLLTSISGVSFERAQTEAVEAHLGPHAVRFIGRRALIENKKASGRDKDRVDARQLEARMQQGE
ncbi:MAG: hypothetical protein ACPGUV_08945 [Polyangiales bacterium]